MNKKQLHAWSIFVFILFLLLFQACTPPSYLNPPAGLHGMLPIPFQTTYETESFFFQPPMRRKGWNLLTNIGIRETTIKKNKITIYNYRAQAWISVSYLPLAKGKRFETQRELIGAFVAGEEEYLAGKPDAPITKKHIHQGFRGRLNPATPKTEKIGNYFFKTIKWYSMDVDNNKKYLLNLYVTPAKDLSGVFVIAMVSPEIPTGKGGNIRHDLEMVVESFETLR